MARIRDADRTAASGREVCARVCGRGGAELEHERRASKHSWRRAFGLAGRAKTFPAHNGLLALVATENSESSEKSRVLAWAAVVSPAWISSSDRSFLGLHADSLAGRLWGWRRSPSVISCTFFAAS